VDLVLCGSGAAYSRSALSSQPAYTIQFQTNAPVYATVKIHNGRLVYNAYSVAEGTDEEILTDEIKMKK
jgi:hypothetical protein